MPWFLDFLPLPRDTSFSSQVQYKYYVNAWFSSASQWSIFMTLVTIREIKRDIDCVITCDCPKGREWSINKIPKNLRPPTMRRFNASLKLYQTPRMNSLLCALPRLRAAGSMPYISTPSHHSLRCCCRSINRRPYIKIEHRFSCRFWRSGIVVDHISDLLWLSLRRLSLHVPIMAIEGRLSPTRSSAF